MDIRNIISQEEFSGLTISIVDDKFLLMINKKSKGLIMAIAQKLTKIQAAIIGAYTGVTCGPFEDIHKYAEMKFKRSIFTHEFASKELCDKLQELSKEDFISICVD